MHNYKKGDVVRVVVDPVNHPDRKRIFCVPNNWQVPLELGGLYTISDTDATSIYINDWWVKPEAVSYPRKVEEELD